jgi:U3 small nucleolar RNA-associated protein 3
VLALPDSSDDDVSEVDEDIEEEEYEDDGQLEQLTKAAAAAAARSRVDGAEVTEDEDEDELGGWGTTTRDLYGADEIDTEQAALDEEAEAKRIQTKQLQAMTDADYGFDESEWAIEGQPEDDSKRGEHTSLITEKLPEVVIPEDASTEEVMEIMKERYPEFEALSKEFLALQPEHRRLRASVMKGVGLNSTILSKYWAVAAYLSSLAMYFAILTETSNGAGTQLAKTPTELHDHGVMQKLVTFRERWIKIRHAPEEVNKGSEASDLEEILQNTDELELNGHTNGVISMSDPQHERIKKSKKLKSTNQTDSTKISSSAARRAARQSAIEEDLAQFSSLVQKPTSNRTKATQISTPTPAAGDDSDFGDETELTPHEAAEKAKRRKTLRFYTSQIAQKAQKRGAASRDAGGDMDIPHRERWRDKQLRLAAEAEQRQERDKATKESAGGAVDGGGLSDEYEDLVTRGKKAKAEKKAAKKDAFEARVAAQQGIFDDEINKDGKRKISYQIEKNKGLAPSRRNNIRNPRVKKRMKYEEKMKKLGSMKAVYKGGPGPAGYQGELTGIKTNLVKSIKL